MKDLFTSSMINRKAWLRTDESRVRGWLEQAGTRVIVWFDGQLMVQPDGTGYFSWHDLSGFRDLLSSPVYLGQHERKEYFTCRLKLWDAHFDGLKLIKLRQACRQFDDFHLSLLFHAQGLINWHQNHAFCPACGSAMQMVQAGHARACSNEQCGKLQYPKLDPAVIFSIVNQQQAKDRILLARKPGWDEYRYSVVAGFVEPGETLEDSVKREAYEETGLQVDQVEYVASQPWPFPDALMLGFRCTTVQQDIRLIDRELESARWFYADEIESAIALGEFKMPFGFSIAWHLIDDWFKQQKGYSLRRLEAKSGASDRV